MIDVVNQIPDWLPLVFALAALGSLAGFLAGLMGIGGGIVLVPGLYYSMGYLGFDSANLMHMAVGTSLAIMVPTGLSSARAHWQRGAVDRALVLRIGVGILAGVAAGTIAARYISGEGLRAFFAVALMGLALIMASNPSRYAVFKEVPPQPWSGLAGAVIGFISTLMGIGGAVMNVPFMCLCRVPMHRAVGTAAAQGLFISIPGLLGFIVIGWGVHGLPPLSLGYINLAAFALIVPFSIAMAPPGAKLAHSLPVDRLRVVFAAMLTVLAARMLWDVFHG